MSKHIIAIINNWCHLYYEQLVFKPFAICLPPRRSHYEILLARRDGMKYGMKNGMK